MSHHNLKSLNKVSTKIFRTLIHGLEPENFESTNQSHRRIGGEIGAGQTFMPVCVECLLDYNDWGWVFSIAHYYIQEGDLMADPDMEFLVDSGGIYPLSFHQASLGTRDVGAWFDRVPDSSKLLLYSRYYPQRSLATFANSWMKNIKEQQSDWFKEQFKLRAKEKKKAKKTSPKVDSKKTTKNLPLVTEAII